MLSQKEKEEFCLDLRVFTVYVVCPPFTFVKHFASSHTSWYVCYATELYILISHSQK
jgi:hypothetical protein